MLMSFCEIPREHDTLGPHAVCVSQAKGASVAAEEQEGDSDVETALAALAGESDIDFGRKPTFKRYGWLYKESRQLRGEQRVHRGYRPVTGHTSGGKPYRVEGRLNIKELISRTRCRIFREKGPWARECPNKGRQLLRDSEEVKTSSFVYFGGDHCTPGYIGKKCVIDTGCSRFLIGQNTLEKCEQMLTRRWGMSTQTVQLKKARTFRLMRHWKPGLWSYSLLESLGSMEYCVCTWYLGGAPLLLSKEFLRDLGCHTDLGRGHLFFEKLGVRAMVTTGTQDPG